MEHELMVDGLRALEKMLRFLLQFPRHGPAGRAALLSVVKLVVVLAEDVFAEIVFKIAPDRVDVVRVVLRVVVLQ